jgi:molecular chaperone Hsp33
MYKCEICGREIFKKCSLYGYKCLCSKEYVEGILLSLGKDELYDIIEKEGQIKVDCEFCDREYIFTKKDVDELIKNA